MHHLHGYVLQHQRHWTRQVLCSHGVCATRNHALIVDGRLTSMDELCTRGSWHFITRSMLVNNLKISANRRASVSDRIVI